MDCSMPGFLFYLLECAQTHVHWVSDAIQPSPPSPALNFSQRQSLFQWVGSSYQRGGQSIGLSASASVLPMNIQGWFPLGWTSLISLLFKGLYPVFFFFFCVCVFVSVPPPIAPQYCLREWVGCQIIGMVLPGCPRSSEIHIWRARVADGCDNLVYWYSRKYSISQERGAVLKR